MLLFLNSQTPLAINRELQHSKLLLLHDRLVVLESGLGLESGLKSIFAGLRLGLGLESYGLGLGLGLGGSVSKSIFQVLCAYKNSTITE